jgi:hypothetical protein
LTVFTISGFLYKSYSSWLYLIRHPSFSLVGQYRIELNKESNICNWKSSELEKLFKWYNLHVPLPVLCTFYQLYSPLFFVCPFRDFIVI